MFIPRMCCGRELPDNWSWWVCDTCGYKKDASSFKRNEKASKISWFFTKLFGC